MLPPLLKRLMRATRPIRRERCGIKDLRKGTGKRRQCRHRRETRASKPCNSKDAARSKTEASSREPNGKLSKASIIAAAHQCSQQHGLEKKAKASQHLPSLCQRHKSRMVENRSSCKPIPEILIKITPKAKIKGSGRERGCLILDQLAGSPGGMGLSTRSTLFKRKSQCKKKRAHVY